MPLSNIQIISAPSILGLTLSGVEKFADVLIADGLPEKLQSPFPVKHARLYNHLYKERRDFNSNCKNTDAIAKFSAELGKDVIKILDEEKFPVVLGGDCSILVGVMSGLATKGNYGLIFLDAHADFYEPEKSTTGEVADMDLAIVSGRGPNILTNINNKRPYVQDEHIIHIGQRDWEETQHYHSQDIKKTGIKCFDLQAIKTMGLNKVIDQVTLLLGDTDVEGFWIHFDTDVISDQANPAVDYRLPGGLTFEEIETITGCLLSTKRIIGVTITIFNPLLDPDKTIQKKLMECLVKTFRT